MQTALDRSWGFVLVRGILAILFGIAAFTLPVVTALTLVTFVGAFAFVDGIFALIAAFRFGHDNDRWWPLILEGVVGILFGLLAFFAPGAIAASLVFLVAAWAIITGILEIMAAIRLRQVIDNEVWLAITGVLSLLLGVMLFLRPGAGVIAWAWALGFYALVYGASLIALSAQMHHHVQEHLAHRGAADAGTAVTAAETTRAAAGGAGVTHRTV